jgi:hypothetical protein
MNNKFILIFQHCHFVEGTRSSLVINLYAGTVLHVPDDFVAPFKIGKKIKVSDLETNMAIDFEKFVCDAKIGQSIDMNLYDQFSHADPANTLDNSSIELCEIVLSSMTLASLDSIIKSLEKFNCNTFVIVIGSSALQYIKPVHEYMQGSKMLINVILDMEQAESDAFISLYAEYAWIDHIYLANTAKPRNRQVKVKPIDSYSRFLVSPNVYYTSTHYNVYFYKRLAIDGELNFRNSYRTSDKFHVFTGVDSVRALLDNKRFLIFWQAHPRKCYGCHVCEFRNMCLNNRVPQINKGDEMYYFDEKCEFEPLNTL